MRALQRMTRVFSAVAVALALVGLGSASAHAASTATVAVLHAVPGVTVDVYANGKALLTDFKPGTLTDPQRLPAGRYDLKVVRTGDGPRGKSLISADNVEVPAGANVTVVAHLRANGKPTLTPYANDVSTLEAGKARLIVRHDAAAPAVDVRAGGKPVFTDLRNPRQQSAEVDAGTIKADVVLAGKDTVVIGPASLKLAEGTTTIVYAWGSANDKNLKLAVQTIKGMNGAPNAVNGGTGGQAAAGSPLPLGWTTVLVAALAAAGISGWQLQRRRVPISR